MKFGHDRGSFALGFGSFKTGQEFVEFFPAFPFLANLGAASSFPSRK